MIRPRIRKPKPPKVPRETSPRHKRATDHRALVLEAVATHPLSPNEADILKDVVGVVPTFDSKKAKAMIWTLRREGLLGLNTQGGHFITHRGLDYLTTGRFDRALPTWAPRNRRRKA